MTDKNQVLGEEMTEKDQIIASLEGLRQDVCCYVGSICDCKFGYESHKHKAIETYKKGKPYYPNHGENTGCPELRVVVALLRAMTEREYEAITLRAMNRKDK